MGTLEGKVGGWRGVGPGAEMGRGREEGQQQTPTEKQQRPPGPQKAPTQPDPQPM
jgi:hypothetical protein